MAPSRLNQYSFKCLGLMRQTIRFRRDLGKPLKRSARRLALDNFIFFQRSNNVRLTLRVLPLRVFIETFGRLIFLAIFKLHIPL